MGSKMIAAGSGNTVTLDRSVSLDSGGTVSISFGVGRGERQDATFGRLVVLK